MSSGSGLVRVIVGGWFSAGSPVQRVPLSRNAEAAAEVPDHPPRKPMRTLAPVSRRAFHGRLAAVRSRPGAASPLPRPAGSSGPPEG